MKVDDRILPRARKNHTAILQALAELGQTRAAELLGVSEATISRMKEGLEGFAALMAAVGKKAVGESQRLYDDEWIDALEVLAKRGIEGRAKSERGSLD